MSRIAIQASGRVPRGFTLVEVLLALALAAALAGGVFTFLWDLLGRRDALLSMTARTHGVAVVFERLEADLPGALVGDAGVGAGVSGDATRLRLLTRGVDLAGARSGAGGGDLQGLEIEFDPAAGVLRARRWSAGPGRQPGEFETVTDGLRRLRFRYFTGREWASSFDSLSQGLPVAIEVSVWFGEPAMDGEEQALGPDDPPLPEPDRRRVFIVPDGPGAAWRDAL